MSRVTFYPKDKTDYENGWPEKVIGDGFIDLRLDDPWFTDESALYVDNFHEEYEFWDKRNGEWTVEVREDG